MRSDPRICDSYDPAGTLSLQNTLLQRRRHVAVPSSLAPFRRAIISYCIALAHRKPLRRALIKRDDRVVLNGRRATCVRCMAGVDTGPAVNSRRLSLSERASLLYVGRRSAIHAQSSTVVFARPAGRWGIIRRDFTLSREGKLPVFDHQFRV